MVRPIHAFLGSTIVLASMALTGPARAEYYSSPYIGIAGGYNLRLRHWDLGKNATTDATGPGELKSSPIGTLRLGYQILPKLAIEIVGVYLPVKASNDNTLNHAAEGELSVLYHFLRSSWTPYIVVGGGGYYLVRGSLGKDADWAFFGGLGLRGLLLRWLALRIEGRDVVSDGFDKKGSNNVEVLGGLDFFLFGPPKKIAARAPDRDHDGIPDAVDRCPDQPGPRATHGCPDKDGDGVIDSKDQCPDVPGKPELEGCPEPENKDSDGDGVMDSEDKCPDAPGKPELAGCPDHDNDGVPDGEDKCPDQAGLKEEQGCLPEAVAKFTGVIKGITFKTGKAEIAKSSYPVLEAALNVLKQYPSLRLRIEGHTDNVGKSAKNLKLSQARADAVKAYFVKKDVAENRLEAVGLGDTKPQESNRTAKGRTANRRIEFAVVH